ncbi:MAG: hypothetical protein ABI830_11800, partial [Pseudolabrys sp.]
MSGGKIQFLFVCLIVLVTAGSVVFGLDYMSAPMTPMPEINVAAYAPPPPPPKVVAPAPVTVPNPNMPGPLSAPLLTPAPTPAPSATRPPPRPVVQAPKPLCDVAACASAFISFTASDCTYQPSFGPRRLCTRGVPPPADTTAVPDAQPSIIANEPGVQPGAPASPKCNVT